MLDISLQFTIPLLFVIGLALFVSASLNMSFDRALPIGILASVLIVFLFGFLDLRIGLAISVIISVTSIPIALIKVRQNKYGISYLFFNAFFLAFLVIYIFLFALNAGKCFDRWDEYSHWGMMTKEMYRLNRYYYVKESVLVAHREYPPFTQLWQYVWCKLIGTFKESSLYNAKLTLCLSVLLSSVSRAIDLRNVKGTKVLGTSITISMMVILLAAVPMLADGSMYRTIYAEGTMVILAVYTITCVLFWTDEQRYDLLSYALSMSSLVLVKQIGILFASISLLILVIRYIEARLALCTREQSYLKEKINKGKRIYDLFFVGITSAFIPWVIWNRVSKVHTTTGQFDSSKFSLSWIMDVIQGRGKATQYQCIRDYLRALFTWKLTWIPGTGYILLALFMLLIMLFTYVYLKKRAPQNNGFSNNNSNLGRAVDVESMLAMIFAMPLTVVGYAVIMQVLYLFGFSEKEMQALACFTRYMNTMLGIWGLNAFIVLLSITSVTKSNDIDNSEGIIVNLSNRCGLLVFGVTIIVCMFIIGISGLKYEFIPGIFTTGSEGLFESDAERINRFTTPGSRIYFVDTIGNDSGTNIVRFLADGRLISDFYVSPKQSDYYKVVQYMRNFDYIYLYYIDDEFVSAYGELFSDGPELSRQQMYKIDLNGDSMVLSYVNMSE